MRIAKAASLVACMLIGAMPGIAAAEGKSIIVLDASGSMWGRIDGRPKLEIAREALASVLAAIPAETEIGLMAYGHRSKGDCGDIELVVPPAAGSAQAIIDAANAMKFLGKTPLSDAVRQAAGDLRYTEEKATVILITDGIETCAADPCALGAELEASGVDFTAHVVGFGLTDDEGRAVACLAENTGGKYIQAADAGALVDALKTTVAVVEPDPVPEPAPAPDPAPATLDRNIDPVVVLTQGGEEPEIVRDAVFEFYPMTDQGPAQDYTATIYGMTTDLLPAGRYLMKTTLHEATAAQEVEITETALAQPVVVLEAGIIELKIIAAEGEEPDPDAYFEMRGPDDISESGWAGMVRVFPAGEYGLMVKLGAAETSQSVVIDAGQTLAKTVIMGVGLAVIDAFYTDAMKVEGTEHYVEILETEQAMDGSRKSLGYAYGAGAGFDLPPGDYIALVQLGAATVEVPFAVKSGERTEVKALLNAGVVAVTLPGQEYVELLGAAKDITGNRKSFGYGYGTWQTTAPAGEYIVVVEKDGQRTETAATIKAGERTEITPALP